MPPQSISAKFGVVFRRRREAAGIFLPAVAALTGLHPTTIGQSERGLINISLTLANHFAHTFGRTLGEMLTEAEQIRGPVEVLPVRHRRRARNHGDPSSVT